MSKINNEKQSKDEHYRYAKLIQSFLQRSTSVFDQLNRNFDDYKKMMDNINNEIKKMRQKINAQRIVCSISIVTAVLLSIITANPIALGLSITAACINVGALILNEYSSKKLQKFAEDVKNFDKDVQALKKLFKQFLNITASTTCIADKIVLGHSACYETLQEPLVVIGKCLETTMTKLNMQTQMEIVDPKDQTDDIMNSLFEKYEMWYKNLFKNEE